jgi:hypothetical protein
MSTRNSRRSSTTRKKARTDGTPSPVPPRTSLLLRPPPVPPTSSLRRPPVSLATSSLPQNRAGSPSPFVRPGPGISGRGAGGPSPLQPKTKRGTGAPKMPGGGTARETALAKSETTIKNRLAAYDKIANDDDQTPERVRLLGELDHEIYKWFDTLKITDFDTDPRAAAMRKLMEELDAKHVNVVKAAMKADVVPVYTAGLTPEEHTQAERLWTSVSKGAGMLQIQSGGDDAFQEQTLSSIAKMLHTHTGRDLIEHLDRPGAGAPPGIGALPGQLTGHETFIIPATEALTHAGFAGATGKETDSSNKPLSQVTHGSKFDSPYEKYTKLTAPPQDAEEYPVVRDPMEYNRAIFDRKPGFAITSGGVTEYYTFGTGEGSALVMQYGQFSRGMGPGNVEVISPNFVLLAHEMGHALRVRGGGYAKEEQFKWFGETKPNWSNRAEEMSNVLGIENPIRQENGITTRSTYQTWKHVHGDRERGSMGTDLGAVMKRVENAGFTAEDAWTWAKTRPEAKMLFLYGNRDDTFYSDADKADTKDLNDRLSTPLINEARSALPTFYNDFMASQVAAGQVSTRLHPYLVQISGDNTKATALMNSLTAPEKLEVLAYLHAHRKALAPIRALLHFGKSDLIGTTESKRADARLAALRALIAPGGTIATARTRREAVSSISLPWA